MYVPVNVLSNNWLRGPSKLAVSKRHVWCLQLQLVPEHISLGIII